MIGSGIVSPEPSKVLVVQRFEAPKTKTQVRAFLGLTGYYRRFIPNYSAVALPLTELTKKMAPTTVTWTLRCETAFQELKRLLCSTPVLASPDFEKPFILQTDASEYGVGAVLSQRDEAGGDHPIAYFSRKLLPREVRYSTVEKECLAIKLGMETFRVYLLGRKFTVETDHRSLVWLNKLKGKQLQTDTVESGTPTLPIHGGTQSWSQQRECRCPHTISNAEPHTTS